MFYITVILFGIDENVVSSSTVDNLCQTRIWFVAIGFSLLFGTIFAKTWRIYFIFNHLKPNTKLVCVYHCMVCGQSQLSTQKQPSFKKKCAPVQDIQCEKSCEIKGGGQEMAVMVQIDGKNLIRTIQVNFCCLIPASVAISTKFTVIKILSINLYTISAISRPPPLISQFFKHWPS